MRQKFAEFNRQYFGGQLPIPQFSVTAMEDEWGRYTLGAQYDKKTRRVINPNGLTGKLLLTNAYSRNEKAVEATLIHEMAHEYVYLVMGIYPKDIHGREFMTAARNAIADGWNVEAETVETDEDIYGGQDEQENSILCIIKKPAGENYKWWICKCDKNNMQQFKSAASKIQGVTNVMFYQIPSAALAHVKSDPASLFGWGGMSYGEVVKKMANYCGVSTSEFDGKKMTMVNM